MPYSPASFFNSTQETNSTPKFEHPNISFKIKIQTLNHPDPPHPMKQNHQNQQQRIVLYTFCFTIGLLCSTRFNTNSETSFTILTWDVRKSSQISSNLYTGVTLSSSDVAESISLDRQYDSTALLLDSIFSPQIDHKKTLKERTLHDDHNPTTQKPTQLEFNRRPRTQNAPIWKPNIGLG